MGTFAFFVRNYLLPLVRLATFFPRMILLGIFRFLKFALVDGALAAGVIMMATVFPACVIGLAFTLYVGRDTTTFWNGIGFSVFALLWGLLVSAIYNKLAQLLGRLCDTITSHFRKDEPAAP